MRKRFEFKWEQLDECTSRAKVVGGWAFRSRRFIEGKQSMVSESMIFIADQNHEWEILKPTEEKPPELKVNPADFKV